MQWKSYRYRHTADGIVITQYVPETEETSVQIPAVLEGSPVTEIGEEAFAENGAFLERVEIPSSVKRIGDGAFKMCMSLTELILHSGLETVGAEALYLTPVEELYLPDTVSALGQPWELGGIRFRIDAGNPYFSTDGYGLYRKPPGTDGTEKELLVVYQPQERTEYVVEAGTTVIGENAVAGNPSLQEVRLPDSVHTICAAAFEGCQQLREIVLPAGLRRIGANAFSHCISLRSLQLPPSLEELGEYAVSDTFGWSESLNGLEQITVAEGNPVFEADAGCLYQKLFPGRAVVKYFGHGREYQIREDVTQILPGAFRRADVRKLSVPKSVREAGKDAFRECRYLEEIFLEESGTRLYVPGQPVYRKDEVTALFYSPELEARRQEVSQEEIVLPEKWQVFARAPISGACRKRQEDPYRMYVFDYRGYDGLFHTYLNLPDQYGMALCRLKYPVLLDAEVRQGYEDFLKGHLAEILDSIAGSHDLAHLADLAQLGFFTAENIEEALEHFYHPGCAQEMSYLLNFKQEYLGTEEFDFSL